MIIICDFDNTLFDTRAFLSQLAREWSTCGVPQALFSRTYKRVRREALYSPRRHIFEIGSGAIQKKTALLEKVQRVQDASRRFIFRDVVPSLKRWKRRGYRLILLTYGDRVFQREKLEKSGIAQLFERVIVTRDPYKIAMVKRLANGSNNIAIIDDNFGALRRLHEKVGGLVTIHVERYRPVDSRISKCGILSVSNLFQVDRLLMLREGSLSEAKGVPEESDSLRA